VSSGAPGQRRIAGFPRYGLPPFATRWPFVSEQPTLRVGGEVGESLELPLSVLGALPRMELVADLHCVVTWTAGGLRWSGFRFRDVWERFIAPRGPATDARWLLCKGADGFRAALWLPDALAPDVLLADRLDGAALPLEHGAPLRIVAPAQYGYKSVKHLVAVEVCVGRPRTSAGWREHARGRVALEERSEHLPGWVWRWIWRALLPPTRWWYARAARMRETGR
jgi:DMSO/TMAO reductase YedYZ molybdopterin-dependent catalytic subunit